MIFDQRNMLFFIIKFLGVYKILFLKYYFVWRIEEGWDMFIYDNNFKMLFLKKNIIS